MTGGQWIGGVGRSVRQPARLLMSLDYSVNLLGGPARLLMSLNCPVYLIGGWIGNLTRAGNLQYFKPMATSTKPDDNPKAEEFRIQAYTLKQLADAYKVPERTFRRWLQPILSLIGPRIGHYFNPKQVKKIVDYLGMPFVWFATLLMKLFFGVDMEEQQEDAEHPKGEEPKSGKG